MGLTSTSPKELFAKEDTWRRSIAAKLWESNRYDLGNRLEACGESETICLCQGCGKHQVFKSHCDLFYCPRCQSRLSYKRKLKLEWWSRQVKEPKHLVLTARNRNSLTKTYVQFFKTRIRSLLHSKLFSPVVGGLCSLEVTNEGRGWHLHSHLLLETPFIPIDRISKEWAKRIQQDFAIVKIKDCSEKSYLQEVTKYAVKGSMLASWSGHEIAEFIDAFQGIRTFGTFGQLYKDQALRARALKELGSNGMECPECGNYDFWFLSPSEFEWFEETGHLPAYCRGNSLSRN